MSLGSGQPHLDCGSQCNGEMLVARDAGLLMAQTPLLLDNLKIKVIFTQNIRYIYGNTCVNFKLNPEL